MRDTAVNEVRTTLRDDLIAARALIDTPEKWCKGRWKDSTGRHCAFGALVATLTPISGPEVDNGDERKHACISALDAHAPSGGFIDFNDHPDTTHPEIMALFDRAIASAESSS